VVPGSRAANIGRYIRAIDAVCERPPGPDLVLLPAGCDADPSAPDAESLTAAMGHALGGLLAMKAREWGVYVAGGYRTRDAAGPLVCGVLLDADGDALLRTRRGDDAGALLRRARATAIGRLGLVLGAHLTDGVPEDIHLAGGVVLVAGGGAEMPVSAEVEARLGALARAVDCYVCGAFAAPSGGDHGGAPRRSRPCVVYGPGGSPVAYAGDDPVTEIEVDTATAAPSRSTEG
jgi:predicted amidohydrolase